MQRFFVPIANVLIAIAVFFFFTDGVINNPVVSSVDAQGNSQILGGIRSLTKEKDNLNEALANATKLRDKIQQLSDDYNDISSDDRAKLDKFLPDNIDNIQLILDTNTIAARHGMAIKGIKVSTTDSSTATQNGDNSAAGGPVVVGKYKADVMTLSFKVSSSYDNFQKFIIDLSRSLRVTDISTVSFDSNDKNAYDYQVDIKTYWLR